MQVLLHIGLIISLGLLTELHAQEGQSPAMPVQAAAPAQQQPVQNQEPALPVPPVNLDQPVGQQAAPESEHDVPTIPILPEVQSQQMNMPAPQMPAQPMQAAPSSPMPAPQPSQAQQAAAVEEIKGIDTVDLQDPQGNWLFKRIWWQKGQAQYEKINALVQTIMDSRMEFFKKRSEWDKNIFDPFYIEAGLGRGVLEELTSSLIAQINQEKDREGDLDENERTLLQALTQEKEALEQLQKDIQKINEIDLAIDNAITVLMNQINRARGFENSAWQNFKQIAQEINDKKARELFYGMATQWQNANEIAEYIHTSFAQYFDQLGVLAQEQIKKVTESLQALKEKGIDFKKQWQILEEKNAKHGHEEKEEEEQPKQAGFFGRIVRSVGSIFSTAWSAVKSVVGGIWDFTFGRFFGAKKENIDHIPEVPAAPDENNHEVQPAPAQTEKSTEQQIVPENEKQDQEHQAQPATTQAVGAPK